MNIFFSVVIPTYNRSALILPAVQAALHQTFFHYEVIVIDDGSTDNTKSLLIEKFGSNSKFRYEWQENAERGVARNLGIKKAKGDFVVFCDSDDEMKKNYLEQLYFEIEKQPKYNFYAAKYRFVKDVREYNSSITKIKQGTYGIDIVLEGNPFACNICIRKNNPWLILFEEDRTLATTEDWMFLVTNLNKDIICVFNFYGLLMHQHDNRSMQQNQVIIERRIKATETLLKKQFFTERQKRKLWGYTYYFCAIHAYLDFNRQQGLSYLQKAIMLEGLHKNFVVLFFKLLVGQKTIKYLKVGFGL